MSNLEWYEWIIYFLTFTSICILGTISFRKPESKYKDRTLYLKNAASAVFLFTSIYWIITFPYVSSFYQTSDKTEFPANITVEMQADYIVENRRRIESLERDLKETKDELEAVRDRIKMFLELFMYALIYFGVNWFFYAGKKNSEEDQDKLNLDL